MLFEFSECRLGLGVDPTQILTVLLADSTVQVQCADDALECFAWPLSIVLHFFVVLVFDFLEWRLVRYLLVPEHHLDVNVDRGAVKLLDSPQVLDLQHLIQLHVAMQLPLFTEIGVFVATSHIDQSFDVRQAIKPGILLPHQVNIG